MIRSPAAVRLLLTVFPFLVPTLGLGAQGGLDGVEATLVSPNVQSSGRFGTGTALEGDTLIVGAPFEGPSGRAYVYEYDPALGEWQLLQQLIPGVSISPNASYGYRAAISGNRVVIGSIQEEPLSGGATGGAVHIFERGGGGWTWTDRIPNPNPNSQDFFGHGLDVEGDRILVGAPLVDAQFSDEGRAFLYQLVNGSWTHIHTFASPQPAPSGGFGSCTSLRWPRVGLSASRELAGGVPGGAAYVCEYSQGLWTCKRLTADTPTANAGFGYCLDVGTKWIALAERNAACSTSQVTGKLHVYANDATCTKDAELCPSGPLSSEKQPSWVVLVDDVLLSNAPKGDEAAPDAGALYLFERQAGSWTQLLTITSCRYQAAARFGSAFGFDGERIGVGAVFHDQGVGLKDAGAAWVVPLSPGQFRRMCPGNGAGTPCPCGNDSSAELDDGCTNSATYWGSGESYGGRLSLIGSDSVSQDDLIFQACNLPPNQFVLLFTGTAQPGGGAGVPFGAGLLCAGGEIVRRGPPKSTGPLGEAEWGPGLSVYGAWTAGQALTFQGWYRDPVMGCEPFNTTGAIEILFSP